MPDRTRPLSRRSLAGGLALLGALPAPLRAQSFSTQSFSVPAPERSRAFVTSDGVRLHYIEAGPAAPPPGPALLFVPGWTMPAWIWERQIAAFAPRHRVVALDPRGQGESEAPPSGYDPFRRGQDIAELAARLAPQPVLLIGWSLGVLDCLACAREHGDGGLAGLVLVDNSVGEEPAPAPRLAAPRPRHPVPREIAMRGFVRSMFRRPPGEAWLDRLTEDALRTPQEAADRLLRYPLPRTYWRDALYSVRRPVLYAITPKWLAQAENVRLRDPYAEIAVFADAGHALFVDDAARFNAVLADFIARRIGA